LLPAAHSIAAERQADNAAEPEAGSLRGNAPLPFTFPGAFAEIDLAGTGTSLPDPVRRRFESSLGHDFGNIRIHASPSDAKTAERFGVKALTVGRHIVFGPGRYSPEGREGQRLLAHELTHVVQQRHAATTPWLQGSPLDDVRKVRSFEVEGKEATEEQLKGQLAKRLEKRRKEIAELLSQTKNEDRKKALTADLARPVLDILTTPDSKGINPDLRKDVIQSSKGLTKATAARLDAQAKWSALDATFADQQTVKTLASIGLAAADLKALGARESGDFINNPQGSGIAVVFQIGAAEEKRAGGTGNERKDPKLAVPLAAKVLVDTATDLKKALTDIPAGVEWKKFLVAAYNAGPFAIGTAQRIAKDKGLSGTDWNELAKGGDKSALYLGLQKHYKSRTAAKYSEVVNHVKGIIDRLRDVP